jgi:hypothetical protein
MLKMRFETTNLTNHTNRARLPFVVIPEDAQRPSGISDGAGGRSRLSTASPCRPG